MKEKYEQPLIEVVELGVNDVLATSGGVPETPFVPEP